MGKYINPFSDYGFKKLFGEESCKPQLIDLLNALLPPAGADIIKDITFKNTEQLAESTANRKAIFDIYCENERGEKFIVELQKARQDFFKERTIYYSTFPIREQVEQGEWLFDLKAVYCIGILDFAFKDYAHNEPEEKKVVHYVKLKDQDGRTFYDKLTYVYVEMPKFLKKETELETRLDKWLYFINNLEDLQQIPQIFAHDTVFETAFTKAELSKLTREDYERYVFSQKDYYDLRNVVNSATREAMEKGLQEGMRGGILIGEQNKEKYAEEKAREKQIEMAINCLKAGLDISVIATLTGLDPEEIRKLKS